MHTDDKEQRRKALCPTPPRSAMADVSVTFSAYLLESKSILNQYTMKSHHGNFRDSRLFEGT